MSSSNGTAPSTSNLVQSSDSPSSPTSNPSPNPSSPSAPADESSAAPTPSEDDPTPTPSPSPPPSNTEPPSASDPPSSQPPPSSAPPASTPADEPSSTPAPSSAPPDEPSSTPDAAPSSQRPQSSRVPTSVVTAPSREPSTQVFTSFVTPSATRDGESPTPSVVIITTVITPTLSSDPTDPNNTDSVPTSTSTGDAGLQELQGKKESGGLGTGGKTAIAVVVPVVVVAALVIAGILLWRRRKQKKNAEEARRKEVEEYGFNPNNDPTLPAVGMTTEMAEDQSGYRGWGNTTTSSNRKASTTLTSGMTGYSDSNSNPGGYHSPGSPTQAHSDAQSNDPLMNGRRETLDSEGIGALGAAPNASQNQSGVRRGPSNASSSYSAANHSDNSGDYPMPMNNPQEYYDNNNYYHASPYGADPYAGNQQPIIRDVSARRNTRIENPSVFPQQGNSGIAQNF